MMRNETIEKYKLAGKIRLVSFSLLGGFLVLMSVIGGYSYINVPLAILIIAEIFFNQPYSFILDKVNSKRFQYYQMATDIICITWITYYLGGEEVPFMALAYAAVILWAGSVSTQGAVFFAAALSSLLFSSVIILESLGFLPPVSYFGHKMSMVQVSGMVAGNVSFFFAFGYFSALSSRLVRSAEKEKYEGAVRHTHKFRATSYLVEYTAHDAVNCLANITGYAQLLQGDKNIQVESAGMVRSIYSLAVKSTELLTRLMKFSREKEREDEKVDINSVVEDAVRLTDPLLRYSKITFKMEFSPDLPGVLGERVRLQEVFTALVLNSHEAIEGKGEINIKTFLLDNERKICIMFSDTGSGMREEEIARVKSGEPFLKTEGESSKISLGLVTAREIISKHSGSIDIESSKGRGTTVIINLPTIR